MASSVPGGVSVLPLRNFYESTTCKLLCVLPTSSNSPVKRATLSFRLLSSLRHPHRALAASRLVEDEGAVHTLSEAESGPESTETFRCINGTLLHPSLPKEKATINPQDMEEQCLSKCSTPLELHTELLLSIESKRTLFCAASIGLALLLMGIDENSKALALGPEGPLVEEFWDNVRRYGLYALTVSTGAIYTILQPMVELLKNPLSAILLILMIGGSGYLIYQMAPKRKIIVKLKSYWVPLLEDPCKQIIDAARITNAKINDHGPRSSAYQEAYMLYVLKHPHVNKGA